MPVSASIAQTDARVGLHVEHALVEEHVVDARRPGSISTWASHERTSPCRAATGWGMMASAAAANKGPGINVAARARTQENRCIDRLLCDSPKRGIILS